MGAPLLEMRGVDVFYGPIQALFAVNLSVQRGEVVVVLGGNASGKSTTVKTVLGLVTPRAGEVIFDGERVNGRPTHEMIARGLASIPEGRRIFPEMSVLENITLGGYVRRGEKDGGARGPQARELDEVFAMFPRLAERRGQVAGTLSGGEQQMLAMARAWMRKPRLLCIDEPSMGLSPLFVDMVYDILARWKADGLTILMVEQNANMALMLADRGYVLKNGAIAVEGTAAELSANPEVRRAYLGG